MSGTIFTASGNIRAMTDIEAVQQANEKATYARQLIDEIYHEGDELEDAQDLLDDAIELLRIAERRMQSRGVP